eukprot:COSAG01_NODE_740_length_13891_cov_35.573013_15_plen_599_part_00
MRKFIFSALIISSLLLGLYFVLEHQYFTEKSTTNHHATLSKMPIYFEGRLQPLDSLARNSFLFISGKQNPSKKNYFNLFLSLISSNNQSDHEPLFLIRDPQLLDFLKLSKTKVKRYPFYQLKPSLERIWLQADYADKVDEKERSAFQKNIRTLRLQIDRYLSLKHSFFYPGYTQEFSSYDKFSDLHIASNKLLGKIHSKQQSLSDTQLALLAEYGRYLEAFQLLRQQSIFYPIPAQPWMRMGDSLLLPIKNQQQSQIIDYYYNYFAKATQPMASPLNQFDLTKSEKLKLVLEYYFNKSQLYYYCLIAYLVIFLLTLPTLVIHLPKLSYFLDKFLIFIFFTHGLGMIIRMIIQGRPPVTNLYSSVVFVAWVSIFFFIILDKLFKLKFGQLIASLLGFSSLIIAHQLSLSGDTLEQMRAVLDSNFWLSTHVVLMCIGYGAMYVAGFIGTFYIIMGVFTTKLTKELSSQLYKMTYGTLCAGLLFSVIGTLLGGIWGDQSWGRFWGWDPKENGAFLIVLWGALILHARLAGMIHARGIMILSALGNIITSFSWFGVNMLGIGLHSYGFMEGGFLALAGFMIVQLYIVILGLIPTHYWKSLKP